MFVKVNNEQAEIYPYTIGMLRKDNPNTSFPKNLTDELLIEYGMYRVKSATQPEVDEITQQLVQDTLPKFINDEWVIGWTIIDKDQDQINKETQARSETVRSQRNFLLLNSDWTQLSDAPLTADQKTAWANYRQELRDITDQVGFPTNILWPTEP